MWASTSARYVAPDMDVNAYVWDANRPEDPDFDIEQTVLCIDCLYYQQAYSNPKSLGFKSVVVYWFPLGRDEDATNTALALFSADYGLEHYWNNTIKATNYVAQRSCVQGTLAVLAGRNFDWDGIADVMDYNADIFIGFWSHEKMVSCVTNQGEETPEYYLW
jgi:hypothetical protein